ncbi:MAG: hypothetical protein IJ598_13440 [Ruminococcus sp.]|nr:hypothetical protein [Ruminococcus sp.]
MLHKTKKGMMIFLTMVSLFAVMATGMSVGSVKADAASWNGTNYGGGSVAGYRTFLEAYGIDYDTYMKWMDDHDADSPQPNYYIGTRYVGYDHRNPNGDCGGAYGSLDSPGTPALNCTGFVWHVLYKSAVHSGASRAQINRLPVMGAVLPTWANLGIYRIYFRTKEEALASGILEKGDLLWMYGTKDNHNAIFYGESSDHDRYWHSAGPNSYGRIDAPGTFLGMWIAKVTQPNQIYLAANPNNNSIAANSFGAKYCIFDSKAKAEAAQKHPSDMNAWDQRIGTIALNSKGYGELRTAAAPSKAELWVNGKAQTNLSYFSAAAKKVSAKSTYYALQWSPAQGAQEDNTIYQLKDSKKRTSTGYRIFGFKIPKKVATPTFSSITSTSKGVKLSWNAVRDADNYRVYYKNRKGDWVRMAETTSTSYVDTDVNFGTTYTYTIRCVDNDGDFISSFNNAGWKHTHQGLPTPQFSSFSSEADGVHLHWNAVSGAEKYRVYYLNSKGSWTRMGETSATSFVDDVVTAGNSYTYTIRCVDRDGDFTSDYAKTGWKYTYTGIEAPKLSELTSQSDGIRLSWQPVSGAAKYRLYYKGKDGTWKRLAETAGTSFVDTDVSYGNTYTYTIRSLNSKGSLNSGYEAAGWSCRFTGVDTPQITSLVKNTKGIQVNWGKVEGAVRYRVFRLENGSWKRVGDTAALSLTDVNVKSGVSYTYTVRCLGANDNYISAYNSTGSSVTYSR